MKYVVTVGKQKFIVEIRQDGEVIVDGVPRHVDLQSIDNASLYSLIVDGRSYDVFIDPVDEQYVLEMSDGLFEVTVQDERTHRLSGTRPKPAATRGEMSVKTPMPGIVMQVLVSVGDRVAKGDALVVLESMKMQNEFKTPQAGTVVRVNVAVGDTVDRDHEMVVIAPEPATTQPE